MGCTGSPAQEGQTPPQTSGLLSSPPPGSPVLSGGKMLAAVCVDTEYFSLALQLHFPIPPSFICISGFQPFMNNRMLSAFFLIP